MNYLAHIFLSGTNGKMQLGNFIGDAIKGNSYKKYPQAISDGILLHRAIDHYTDQHPVIKETIRTLKPHFGRYSGVLLDIYLDYLLASRFASFTEESLKKYTRRFYLTLIINYRYLPKRVRSFVWYFIGTDRLGKYAKPQGIREALYIMVDYRNLDISVDEAIQYLTEHEEELFTILQPFFLELQAYCKEYIQEQKKSLKRTV